MESFKRAFCKRDESRKREEEEENEEKEEEEEDEGKRRSWTHREADGPKSGDSRRSAVAACSPTSPILLPSARRSPTTPA